MRLDPMDPATATDVSVRVLVAEPRAEQAARLCADLEQQGLRVVRAGTADEMLARALDVDCVLLAVGAEPAWAEGTARQPDEALSPAVVLLADDEAGARAALLAAPAGVIDCLARTAPAGWIAARLRALASHHRRAVGLAREALLGRDVGLALAQARSLRDALQGCSEALVRHLGAAFARIWTLAPGADLLELQASAGLYTRLDGTHARVPVGRYKIGRIAQERTPHLTNDVLHDPWVSDPEWARRQGMVAFAGYPLRVGEQLVGVMALFARHALELHTLQVLAAVADRVALGIERERADEERRRLASVVESTPDFVGLASTEGRAFYVNTAGQQLVGLSGLEAVRRRGVLDYFLPEDVPFVQGTILPTLAREGRWQGDFRFRHFETGRPVPVHYDLFYTRDEAGRPAGIATVSRDISERVRAEARLRLLAEVSRALSGRLDAPDEALQGVARLAVAELASYCLVDVVDEAGLLRPVAAAHRDPAREPLVARLRALAPLEAGLLKALVRSGGSRCVAVFGPLEKQAIARSPEHLELLEALGGRTSMAVAMVSRGQELGLITLVSSEEDVRYGPEDLGMAEELARRVAGALDNARLYQDAQRAVRLRDEFLSVASHELKTPLTPMSLKLDALARAAERAGAEPGALVPEHLLRDVEVMRRQVRRLADLVSDLLDVSRIGAGRLQLQREPLDLGQLVREVVQRLEAQAERTGVRLVLRFEEGVEGEWDRLRLEQVVLNLLSNALKYGQARPVHVEVERVEGRPAARLRVRDEGIGIPAEALPRIFQKFERAVSERHYGGLGLGLFITQQLVEAMGGRVWAESEEGQGATFTVELDLSARVAAQGPPKR